MRKKSIKVILNLQNGMDLVVISNIWPKGKDCTFKSKKSYKYGEYGKFTHFQKFEVAFFLRICPLYILES
jgi:hypothetical protein